MNEINEACKDCSQFQEGMWVDDVEGLCGFAVGLGHSQDAKNWCRDRISPCIHKGKTQKEFNNWFWKGIKYE